MGTFLVVQWLAVRTSEARGTGSLPGQGTKIPHAMWYGQENEKKKKKKLKEMMLDLRLMQNQVQSYVASVDCYSDA